MFLGGAVTKLLKVEFYKMPFIAADGEHVT